MNIFSKAVLTLLSIFTFTSCTKTGTESIDKTEYPAIAESETNQVSIENSTSFTSAVSGSTPVPISSFSNTRWTSCDRQSGLEFIFTPDILTIVNTENGKVTNRTDFSYRADTQYIVLYDDEGRESAKFGWKINNSILEITSTSGDSRKLRQA